MRLLEKQRRVVVCLGCVAVLWLTGCGRSVSGVDKSARAAAPAQPASKKPLVAVRSSWNSFRNGNQQLGVATGTLGQKLQLLWKYKTIDGVVTTCAIVGDHVFVPGLSGTLTCLERATGKVVWKYRSIESNDPDEFAPGFKAGPTITKTLVLLGDEDGLFHAVDRRTGKKKWIFRTEAEIAGGASVVGDHVIFGSHDSNLFCLKIADGSVVWKFQTEDPGELRTGHF